VSLPSSSPPSPPRTSSLKPTQPPFQASKVSPLASTGEPKVTDSPSKKKSFIDEIQVSFVVLSNVKKTFM